MKPNEIDLPALIKELTDIGIALSAARNHTELLELILKKAKQLTYADGGTLYLLEDNAYLKFEIMLNTSLDIHYGGTHNTKSIERLNLYNKDGSPNLSMIATSAALKKQTITIADAYLDDQYDFSGSRKFDKKYNYRSQSFLTVPMVDHHQEVIGVLQLINAVDSNTQEIISFSDLSQNIVESLASQAAVTITKEVLIRAQKDLFDSLIQLIAGAIDEKSPYTAGHCRRVPVITKMIAEAACKTNEGPLKNFNLNEEEIYELEVAAWLHDCGKIVTPEYIMDKSTKLETIFDRIHTLDAGFEILKKDAIINSLRNKLEALQQNFDPRKDPSLQQYFQKLDEWRDIAHKSNLGGEYLSSESIKIINKISQLKWTASSGSEMPLLSKEEKELLSIKKGTLSTKERERINAHAEVTLKMLESLPYPKSLSNVPTYAGAHHEKLDGSGYPKALHGEEVPMQSRIIAIADIFEALTTRDRPYKKSIPLSEVVNIMNKMKNDGLIDPNLLDLMLKEKIHEKYMKFYFK